MVTLLLMAASVWGFIAVLKSYGPNNWALPVYVAIIAVLAITGSVLAWRVRDR